MNTRKYTVSFLDSEVSIISKCPEKLELEESSILTLPSKDSTQKAYHLCHIIILQYKEYLVSKKLKRHKFHFVKNWINFVLWKLSVVLTPLIVLECHLDSGDITAFCYRLKVKMKSWEVSQDSTSQYFVCMKLKLSAVLSL